MIGFYNYTVITTYLGLISSVTGILCAALGHPTIAIFCLMFAGLCDMFDGKIARTRQRTKAEQNFGIQLDSLSDIVCFGVLPAVIGFSVGYYPFRDTPFFREHHWAMFLYIGISALYVLCALIRLAYFNVTEEERQNSTDELRKSYEGLPVTSVALIFPVVYSFKTLLFGNLTAVYALVMLIVAAAFITPFRLRKPGTRGLLILLALGLIELIFVIVGGSGWLR